MARSGRSAGFNFTGPLSGIGNSLLRRFGVQAAERKAPEVLKQEAQITAHQGIPLHIQLWLGARLPFIAFTTILGFFTYLYHIVPIVPWLIAFFSLVFAVIVCWPPKHIGEKKRGIWDWGPMTSWLLAVGLAVAFGLFNYGIFESWINTSFLREYKDVEASTDPAILPDAGILTFADDVLLETTMSAGYKFWFYNYCAAPIVGAGDPSSAPIAYWAVGVGCCDSRGGFTCDSAQDKSAHQAVPVRPYNIGPEVTSHYNHAIRMAAAANDLEVAKETVFVMWHKDPKAVGGNVWWICTVSFIGLVLVAMCACFGCQAGLTHMSIMQQH